VLIAMKTPADILDLAYDYIFIIFAGIPITLAYNLLTGIIRSLGDSKSPLIFLLMAAVANIGFDILSVTVLKLGVRGPAFATLLAQAFSVVLSLWCIKTKFPILKMEPGEWKLHGKHIGILCKMGIPMGLQYSITAIGSVVLQTGINTLGSAAVASVSAASKLSMFLACPFDAIGSAMATYTGQNVGAGKIERIGQGLKASVLIGITYSILIFLVMLFSAKYWMLLFINASETEIIHNAVLFILANSGFYIALVFVNAVRFTIQGAGFSGLAILAGVMEMIARAIIGVIMVPYLGFASVCFASPLAWIMADCFLIPAYCHVIRKLKQRRAQGVPNM
jgi:Na+-driven multidrug efflux pump